MKTVKSKRIERLNKIFTKHITSAKSSLEKAVSALAKSPNLDLEIIGKLNDIKKLIEGVGK